MKSIDNWNEIKAAGANERPTAGGYVCIIKKVTDDPNKELLHIEYDIAEGPFKSYAADTAERAGFWPLDFTKSYKTKALGFFKAMIEAIEATNSGFTWTWDEKKLVNKGVGIILREEEYENRNGQLRTRLKPYAFCTANDIRTGNFTVPEAKLLDHVTATPAFTEEEDTGELPF